jgi:bifunctional DNase/RNase
MDKVQVEILGISTSPASNGAYALILRETAGARRIPIIIGGFEAQAIALEMEGIKPPRPLTHDLLKNIVESLSATITEVNIHDLKDGTFYASIVLNGDTEIDSRPSDAIAVAIRFGINIYVAEHVMSEAGFLPDENEEEIEEGEEIDEDEDEKDAALEDSVAKAKPTPSKPLTKLEQLTKQMEEAIQKEDYEKAASLRDDIQRLKASEG